MTIRRSCVECTVRGAHYFCGLKTEALRQLDRMGTQVRYSGGEVVQQEGGASERVCMVCDGTLKLTTTSAEGRMLLLRIAGPGDLLGLAAALKGVRYEATAKALEVCEVRVIARKDFVRFMEEFDGVGMNSAKTVAQEYESAVLSARRLALSNSAAGRLASVLLDWGRLSVRKLANGEGVQLGPKKRGAEEPLRFRMTLTHEELGSMAGISRETATRVLGKLKCEKLIEMEGERMVLLAPAELERLYC